MKRTPEPHGTKAAYMRHWRAGEEACGPCKKAQSKPERTVENRSFPGSKAMDEALKADPPIIQWIPSPGGVLRGVVVRDPHAERSGSPLRQQRQLEAYAQRRAAS